VKNLAFLVRRPDHTREAFRAHYEDIHAPLAMETVMEGTTRYVRHHVCEVVHGDPFFDVITAFEYASPEKAAALVARLATDAGARIIADEHSFMDRARNTFFVVEERPVMGAEARDAGLLLAVCVKRPPDADREEFVARYADVHTAALLDAVASPAWCLHNLALGPEPWADVVTQVHAASDAGLAGWARGLEATGARVQVVSVSEHETETPWD